jgi:hypothetical protein
MDRFGRIMESTLVEIEMNGGRIEELGDSLQSRLFLITTGISKCANRTQIDNSPPLPDGICKNSCKDDFFGCLVPS